MHGHHGTEAPQTVGQPGKGASSVKANQNEATAIMSTPARSTQQHVSASRTIAGIQEVQSILHAGRPTTSSMSERALSPTVGLEDQENRRPSLSDRARSSDAIEARKQKRFTLTLPIQTTWTVAPPSSLPSPVRSTAPSSTNSDEAARPTTPSDTNFLTAIAAQERRVLELKEELVKAEQALHKLKKDWAHHEVQKKRQDIKRARSTRTNNNGSRQVLRQAMEADAQADLVAKEVDRKRVMQYMARTTQRKVFSGSKHARALSLLSPEPAMGNFPEVLPQPEKPADRPSDRASESYVPQGLPELPGKVSHRRIVSGEMQRSNSSADGDLEMPREVLIRAGRQMASDFKDGLWTFLEDLKQVTVGEEQQGVAAGHLPRPDSGHHRSHARISKDGRPQSSGNSPGRVQKNRKPEKPRQKPASRGQGHADHAEQPSPKDSAVDFDTTATTTKDLIQVDLPSSPATRKMPRKRANTINNTPRASLDGHDNGESWDTWDSPQVNTEVTEASGENLSKETTVSADDKKSELDDLLQSASPHRRREPIPWPTLVRLTPGNLRRTASHLYTNLEKSLSPLQETRPMGSPEFMDGTTAMAINAKMD